MAEASNRPSPPKEARSFFLPITVAMVAIMTAIVAPALSRASHAEEEAAAAAAEAEATPETVAVEVRSAPEGAEAQVGDQRCTTPCSLDLAPGEEVTLALTLDGFQDFEQTVTPEAEMDALTPELEAKPYRLHVTAPEGAVVEVNGEATADPTNIELGTELASAVAITVTQPGRRSFETEIAADAFETGDESRDHALTVELERRPVRRPRAAPIAAVGGLPSNPF